MLREDWWVFERIHRASQRLLGAKAAFVGANQRILGANVANIVFAPTNLVFAPTSAKTAQQGEQHSREQRNLRFTIREKRRENHNSSLFSMKRESAAMVTPSFSTTHHP